MVKFKKNKKFLEIAWLVVALTSAATFVHALVTKGIYEGSLFFVIFVLSFLVYLLRRNQGRKKSNLKE